MDVEKLQQILNNHFSNKQVSTLVELVSNNLFLFVDSDIAANEINEMWKHRKVKRKAYSMILKELNTNYIPQDCYREWRNGCDDYCADGIYDGCSFTHHITITGGDFDDPIDRDVKCPIISFMDKLDCIEDYSIEERQIDSSRILSVCFYFK